MKQFLLFSTLALCFTHEAFAQSYNPDFNIVTRLKDYFSTYDPEKAYLQFDRPYYAAGDTIFFKAYVTQSGDHKLSGLSGVLHVDLINTENKIAQSIKLRLENGVGWGDFALADSLPTGNYRIRAYTAWMLNLGESDFFDQLIPIGSLIKRNLTDSLEKNPWHTTRNKPDIQFFPEGGTLVEGIKTKVAFKAIGKDGLAMDVKGVILDKSDRQVCLLKSSHLGMGYFFLTAEKDNAYKAMLNFSDGTQNMVDLPEAKASGLSLSLVNDSSSKISISITANRSFYQANRNKVHFLVIYSGGKTMTYASKQEDSIITLDLEKKVLRSGVSDITLFSAEGEPLCERLLFVNNDDLLKLQIHTDKSAYRKKDKVNLLLNAERPTGLPADGHFSVAITNESQIPIDKKSERNIVTNLLLTSDLKGYVEQPEYYFNDTTEDPRKNLDVLMLTQGYRNFEWKQVLGNDHAALSFQVEKGLEIGGKITNLSEKPISNGTVTLIPSKSGPIITTKSDNKGLFHFSNLVFTDTTHLVISAINSKGGNAIKITYLIPNDRPPAILDLTYAPPPLEDTGALSFFIKAAKWRDEFNDNSPSKGELLKAVTVRPLRQDNQYRTESLAGAGFADQVLHADEIERIGGLLSTSLNGRLRGVSFIHGIPFLPSSITTKGASPMLIVLDGTEIEPGRGFSIDDITVSQVETVEVLKYASASIYGMEGANGVLIITTKNGSERSKDIASVGVLPIAPIGFYKARTFYSPKYDYANVDSTEPELRPTVYWNPEIKMDNDGNAILDYYNADGAGIYKIIVEGIDTGGNIGRLVYRYKVE